MVDQVDYVESSIQRKLSSLPPISSHCLYKVPEHIRKVNRECYQPSVVSIGPIYYKNKSLKSSQEIKLRHLEGFLQLGTHLYGDRAYSLGDYIDIIRRKEDYTRSYYEERINLSSNEFVEMMMVDAAFIIYLFMCSSSDDLSVPFDPMEKKIVWMVKIEQDLFLQDNQLPFFVINYLYDIAFGKSYPKLSFKDLACNFIGETYIPGRVAARKAGRDRVKNASSIKHLVDLLRVCCLPPNPRHGKILEENREHRLCCLPLVKPHRDQYQETIEQRLYFPSNNCCSSFRTQENKAVQRHLCCFPRKNSPQNTDKKEGPYFPPSAKELKAAGVKFMAIDSENLLEIRYAKGVLQIPRLTIQDTTESILRSLIFYEQCHHYFDSYFIDYVFFLDALIDTSEDVQILVKHGILNHWLGSDDEVTVFVNRITNYIVLYTPGFYYADISRKLIAHANKKKNKWKAVLKRDYFNHPWSILSVGYLVILLILTVLQVYTGFKP